MDLKFLRFYASLMPSQKASFSSQAGLTFARFSGGQWDRLSLTLPDNVKGGCIVNGRIALISDTDTVTWSTNGGAVQQVGQQYDITVWIDGQKDPWIVTEHISRVPRAYIAFKIAERKKRKEEAAKPAPQEGPASKENK